MRREQSRKRGEQRRLPRAIGTDDGHDRARRDLERHVAHGEHLAVGDGETFDVDDVSWLARPACGEGAGMSDGRDRGHTPPRYASSTRGSRWMSAGLPSASFSPKSMTIS